MKTEKITTLQIYSPDIWQSMMLTETPYYVLCSIQLTQLKTGISDALLLTHTKMNTIWPQNSYAYKNWKDSSYRTGLAVVIALLWSAWMSLVSPRLELDVVQPPPLAKAFPLPVSVWWRWLELLRVLLQDDWEVG